MIEIAARGQGLPLFRTDTLLLILVHRPPWMRAQVLVDEISSANWTRFCRYAALVREVRLDDVTDARIGESVWPSLLRKSGGRFPDLFPRLQSLSYALPHPYRHTSLQHLLSTSLRKLKLHCRWRSARWGPEYRQEDAVSTLIDTACTDCPELDDLTLTTFEYPRALCTAAEGLKHRLRRLDLRGIYLKFSPTERLSVTGFRALKELSILCDAAEDVSKFLACVISPLERLELCSHAPSSAWLREFAVIGPMVQSLKSLKLELLPEPPELPSRSLHLAQLVEPLSGLSNLEAFSLLVRDTQLVTDDSSFKAVATAWPRLTSFALDGGMSTYTTTLQGLAHFAKHCPHLHTLLLPHLDDTPAVPPDDTLPFQGALRRLSFYLLENMKILDPEATGRAVWRLFPDLDVQGACRMLPEHMITAADEDCFMREEYTPSDRMKREAGHGAWTAVLDVVQKLQVGGARTCVGRADCAGE
ncbi:hypothetical protein K466DRAFT_665998 [Polyporus arcularius HHB13444]|uniref:F-box domain-containing protein n=1 Tax=Polyporus arcularius HHB13444 TaxID=1314778 RepID=A0A5C3P0P0_9APHY|nr:hypothetical protein K466DRAFT_665998 [Polyporus arcularius HHB13444]